MGSCPSRHRSHEALDPREARAFTHGPENGLQLLIPMASVGSWTCPYFIHHALNSVGVGFIPALWAAVSGNHDLASSLYLVELALDPTLLIIAGVGFSSRRCSFKFKFTCREWSSSRQNVILRERERMQSSHCPSRDLSQSEFSSSTVSWPATRKPLPSLQPRRNLSTRSRSPLSRVIERAPSPD